MMARTSGDQETRRAQQLVRDTFPGYLLLASTAVVILQLSWPEVAHGVMESRVNTGRVELHPLKRGRTTISYILIALHGTDRERAVLRSEVDRVHAYVHSTAQSPVRYDAFDVDLQLWVAATIYWAFERHCERTGALPCPADRELVYRHYARLATTLQVPADRWPANRQAFQAYWQHALTRMRIDPAARAFLLYLTDLKPFPWPAPQLLGRLHRFITTGFLPPVFRTALGLKWNRRHQRVFDRALALTDGMSRRLPGPVRRLPLNLILADARRRIRSGRPLL